MTAELNRSDGLYVAQCRPPLLGTVTQLLAHSAKSAMGVTMTQHEPFLIPSAYHHVKTQKGKSGLQSLTFMVQWNMDYFVTELDSTAMCFLYNDIIAALKEYNIILLTISD